jgi:hypothetical protein
MCGLAGGLPGLDLTVAVSRHLTTVSPLAPSAAFQTPADFLRAFTITTNRSGEPSRFCNSFRTELERRGRAGYIRPMLFKPRQCRTVSQPSELWLEYKPGVIDARRFKNGKQETSSPSAASTFRFGMNTSFAGAPVVSRHSVKAISRPLLAISGFQVNWPWKDYWSGKL